MNLMHLVVLLLGVVAAVLGVDSEAAPMEAISTNECNVVRHESYRARLDIFYLYLLEWSADIALDLEGIEQAIASGLVDMLDECDSLGRPKFAIQVSRDVVAGQEEGDCSSIQDEGTTQCRVLRGTTSVLLDADVERVEQLAYFVIGRALNDADLLDGYTEMRIRRAELLQPIGDNLVVLTTLHPANDASDERTGTSIVVKSALASATISFALTVAVAYAMYSRRQSTTRANAEGKTRRFQLKDKHREFFQELHDEESNSGFEQGWMVADSELRSPSITWSVSDLTTDSIDDSQSIRSALPLDRIIEALSEEELPSQEFPDSTMAELETYVFSDPDFIPSWHDIESPQSASTGSDECYHTPRQYRTPPHQQLPFRQKSVAASEADLSISPVTPSSCELGRDMRVLSHDLDSITISLEGCQYLENDVETSDELECSFSSDLANRLDLLVSSFGTIESMSQGMVILSATDDNLLFSDDDGDKQMREGDIFERVWSPSNLDVAAKHRVLVETVSSESCNDDEGPPPALTPLLAIQESLERARTQLLLTYSV